MEKMSGQLANIDEITGLLSGQVAEIGVHVNRATRMQYKTGQDTQEKLEQLSASLDAVRQWQTAHDVDATRLDDLERQNSCLTGALMRWLDDIDHVRLRLQGEEREMWQQLLERWAGQLLQALDETGVYELDLLGASFDPQWAESIGAVGRGQLAPDPSGSGNARPHVPYEVVEVARRGFTFRDGRLLRKAQVITIREETSLGQQQ
jgi:molecular chaperone GrpE (heat shock protein)